mmetsp:Transcript_40851/g.123084  ORF Transcript_40851/g.123084 Transcript_40851/m.123084 type:complete len:95 (-) Transcript_40851:1592-1876(-)
MGYSTVVLNGSEKGCSVWHNNSDSQFCAKTALINQPQEVCAVLCQEVLSRGSQFMGYSTVVLNGSEKGCSIRHNNLDSQFFQEDPNSWVIAQWC